MVGKSLIVIDTVEVDAAQGGFEMVHSKIFIPKPKPVTEVVGESEFVIIPEPEIKLHAPVPVVATFAFNAVVGDDMHKV